MTRTITGLFDTRAEADAVVAHLRQHDGIDASRISVHGSEAGTAATTGAATTGEDRGFWASLKDLFIADEDRAAYAEGIRRGGFVVSAEVDEAILDHALDVFEQHGAVDLDSRESEWRAAGWTGYQPGETTAVGTGTAMNTSAAVGAATMGGTSTPAVGTAAYATGATLGDATSEERIPIVEEQLRVGKRETDRGRVRVRSYIVETPVSESITLRNEHVTVERRSVDLPLSAADDAFRERTIEAVEHSEEVVVSKDARVKEELVIRKEAGEHTETVSDTVRRTEVEVDDQRTAGTTTTGSTTTGTATTGTTATKPVRPAGA